MATAVQLPIQLAFDVPKLNRDLMAIKAALGPVLGSAIKPLDEKALAAPLAAAEKQAEETAAAVKKVGDEGAKAAEKGGSAFLKAFKFDVVQKSVNTALQGLQGLAQPFTALDTATAQLRTLGDDAAKMAPNLREAAISMSKDLPFAAAELQTTMFDALAAGVQGGEEGLKKFADTAAKLAVGGGSSIGDATNLLAGNLNAYGKSAEDAAKFSDIFFNTINYGVTSASALSSTLANVVPTAASLDVELENVGAALAVMTSKGVPTAQSTTKLNQLLLELAKPGAALAPILQKAGVSLESLKRDDLPVTLAKVNQALKETGQTAISAFSSSEAGAAFNVLAGDLDGFADTFQKVRDTTGSTQFAYEQMGDSIENKTKQMLSTINAFIIEGIDGIGSGIVTLANGAGALAPIISSAAGVSQLLPDGFAGKVKDAAVSIVGRLIPSIAAQTAATGTATAAQFSLNAAIAANPIGAAVAGIVLLIGATKLLSDAMHETAAEKLDDAKADTAVLAEQRAGVQARYDAVKAQTAQVAAYKTSVEAYQNAKAAASDETKSEAERAAAADQVTAAKDSLLDKTLSLAAVYPKAADAGKSFEQNLTDIQAAATANADKLIAMGAELNKLDQSLATARSLELSLGVQVSAEELESSVTDALDKGFLDGIKGLAKGDITGFLDSAFLAGFGTEISEAIFGTSTTRKSSENFVASFKKDVFGAKTKEEIAAAQSKMISEIALKGDAMGISKSEQAELIKSVRSVGDARQAELKAQAENEKNLTAQTADTIAKTFLDATAAGKGAGESIKAIASAFGVTEAKVRQVSLTKELDAATASGTLTEEKIAELAKKYGLTTDEAKKLVDEQRKQTKEAAATAEGVKSIGAAFSEAAKAAQEEFGKGKAELAGLLAQRRRGTAEERADADQKIADQIARNRQTKKIIDENTAFEKDAARLSGEVEKKKVKTAKDIEDEITKIRREATAIRAEVDRGGMEDETAQRRAELAAKQAEEVRAVQDEIAAAKKNKELTSDARVKMEAALTEKIAAIQLRQAKQLTDLDASLIRERVTKQEAERKKAEEQLQAFTADLRKIQIETLEADDVRAGDDELARLREVGTLKLDELRSQHRAEIDAYVGRNETVVAAQKKLDAAIQKGDQALIDEAMADLTLARGKALAEDGLVVAAYKRQAQQLTAFQRTEDERAARARIALNTDLAAQQRDVAILEAQKTLDAALAAAKGNQALELKAHREFLAAKRAAELDYIRSTNAAADVAISLTQNLTAAFKSFWDEQNAEQARKEEDDHKKRLQQFADEKKGFLEKVQAGVSTYEEYQKALSDLDEQQRDAEQERQQKADERAQKRREEIAKAFQASADEQAAKFDEMARKGEMAYDRMASAAVLSFAAQIAAGKAFESAVLVTLLDLVSKSITAYVPQIIAASIGLLGPIAGPIAAGVAISAVQVALSAARASLGARHGVVGLDRAYNVRPHSDDVVPFMLAYGETVLSKENTEQNRAALEYNRRTGRSFESYYQDKLDQRARDLATVEFGQKLDILIDEFRDLAHAQRNVTRRIAVQHEFSELHMRGDAVVAVHKKSIRKKLRLLS